MISKYSESIFLNYDNLMFEYYPSCKTKFIPPEVDEEGFSEMQLWKVMQNFGDLLYIGSTELPFELDIKIDDKDLKE